MTRNIQHLLTMFGRQVLDFGASRDGVPAKDRGRRIVVDPKGKEIEDVDPSAQAEATDGAGA